MCATTQIARMIECIYMTVFVHPGVSPHAVGEAFYTGELEHEIREVGLVDFRFKKDSDREKCMESVEELRKHHLYPHPSSDCTEACQKRGMPSSVKCVECATLMKYN